MVALNELNLDLISEHDPKKLIKLFCVGAKKLLGATYCVVGILKNNGSLEYGYEAGRTDIDTTNMVFSQENNGLINTIINKQKVLLLNNISDQSLIVFPSNRPFIRNFLGVPIITLNRVYGFIYFANKSDETNFNEGDQSIASTLGSEVALLYENIEFYDVIQKHAAQLQLEIFQRKKIEKSLINSEELFRQFAENIKEVFWRMSPDMNKVLYISPAYEEIWGRCKENLYINPNEWIDAVLKDDKEKVYKFLKNLRTQESCNVEYRILHSDGSLKYIVAKGFQVKNKKGEVISITGIAADMTEFAQVKAQVHLDDKLKMIGLLAAGVAHEINNPISWVLANLKHIQKNKYSIDKMKLDLLLNETIEGTLHIINIVRNLKGFSYSDQNAIKAVDIHELLRSVISMASAELKVHAHIEINFAEKLPLINCNGGKLHQVFLNLLINAIQAIPIGNSEKNRIVISTRLETNQIRIDISDTGCGINPKILKNIFEPFFTTKPAGMGTGLGLSISRDIIQSIGGKILVKSKVGKGSIFSIYLPSQTTIQENQELPVNESIEISSHAKRILVIDDEPLLLKSVERMLEDTHNVTTVSNGEDAIQILSKMPNAYDVILCDFNMPNLSGNEFYNRIRKTFPGLEKKIIFMTGGIYNATHKKFIAHISNICVDKPLIEPELLKVINNLKG